MTVLNRPPLVIKDLEVFVSPSFPPTPDDLIVWGNVRNAYECVEFMVKIDEYDDSFFDAMHQILGREVIGALKVLGLERDEEVYKKLAKDIVYADESVLLQSVSYLMQREYRRLTNGEII